MDITSAALVLNADYAPLRVTHWSKAVELVLDNKASVVEAAPGRFVRSPSLAVPWPEVVALRRYHTVRARAKFSARNVIARDQRCAYCGVSPRLPNGKLDRGALTMDHVIPRAQAKHHAVHLPWSRTWVNVTCWENCVAACPRCNQRKADRSPAEAGMTLLFLPRPPTTADVLRMSLAGLRTVPAAWRPYVPEAWFQESAPEAGRLSSCG